MTDRGAVPSVIGTSPPTTPTSTTTRRLLELIFDEMGIDGRIRAANGIPLTVMAWFSSTMRNLKREKVYQFTTPWLVDQTRYESAFGAEVTPHTEAVKTTVAWFRDHGGRP